MTSRPRWRCVSIGPSHFYPGVDTGLRSSVTARSQTGAPYRASCCRKATALYPSSIDAGAAEDGLSVKPWHEQLSSPLLCLARRNRQLGCARKDFSGPLHESAVLLNELLSFLNAHNGLLLHLIEGLNWAVGLADLLHDHPQLELPAIRRGTKLLRAGNGSLGGPTLPRWGAFGRTAGGR
ncbi:hypothetical protein MPLA_1870013 [Mesorhizobium sp. ORS 3359]|nr:hypothetical protein MPLA_1870013 [Mesorhizobium sp. ORS 3359]